MDVGSFMGGSGIVGVILAIGGGIRWWVGRRDNLKDPIPKADAAAALNSQAVALMQSVAADMEKRFSSLNGRNQLLENRVSAAEQTLEMLEQKLQAAAHYIEDVWRRARVGAWPLPPVPSELRDLIDPDLHDWASRNPEDHTGPVPDPPTD